MFVVTSSSRGRASYRGYAAFYNWPTSDEHQRQIWGWIHDEGLVEALVAAPVDAAGNETGEIQGLAHLREWVRPLRGVKCGYLDDLFVDPDHRGSGVVDALYDAMRAIATERGWPVIRWTTGDENYRARAVYDKLADAHDVDHLRHGDRRDIRHRR